MKNWDSWQTCLDVRRVLLDNFLIQRFVFNFIKHQGKYTEKEIGKGVKLILTINTIQNEGLLDYFISLKNKLVLL